MPRSGNDDATRVRYLHSNERQRGTETIQIWRSEVTGREFEVRESRSYALSADLEPGAVGYLDFTGGVAAVTRRPLGRSERLERFGRSGRHARGPGGSLPARPRRNLAPWLLVGALLLVVIWTLL